MLFVDMGAIFLLFVITTLCSWLLFRKHNNSTNELEVKVSELRWSSYEDSISVKAHRADIHTMFNEVKSLRRNNEQLHKRIDKLSKKRSDHGA